MIVFKNGDVMLTKSEYYHITHSQNKAMMEISNYFTKFVDLYYKLMDRQYEVSSIANFNPNEIPPDSHKVYKIDEKDFELYQRWRVEINKFKP